MDTAGHEKNLIDLFGRHLVSLSFRFSEVPAAALQTKSRYVAYSGMLISVRRRLLYLTAGHILNNIDSAIGSNRIIIESCSLIDTFGMGRVTDQPIPFQYADAPSLCYDKDGLDFGVVALRQHYRKLLDANGIMPLEETNWQARIPEKLDLYLLLGLPEELTVEDPGKPGYLRIEPTLLRLRKVIDPQIEVLKKSSIDRFYGEITDPLPVSDLKGFSGGPVFGVSLSPPITYWIIAVQSTWVASRRMIAACPVRIIGSLIAGWMEQNNPDGNEL